MAAVTVAACATAAAAAVVAVLAAAPTTYSPGDERSNDGVATKVEEAESSSSRQECAVCLSELLPAAGVGVGVGSDDADEPPPSADRVRTLPGCGHGFHAECIARWLHMRPDCPLCRRPVRVRLESDGAAASGQQTDARAVAVSPATGPSAWAQPTRRIACGFGDGRVLWTRSPSVIRQP